MPLHHKTKESVVKKYRHLEGDILHQALTTDSTNYTTEEIKEILEAIAKAKLSESDCGTPGPSPQQPAAAAAPQAGIPASPNVEIAEKLKAFDYSKLTGEPFKKYCLLVQSLPIDGKYDFELYSVETIRAERYRGMKDSPVDTIGIRIKDSKPINTTRIAVKHALATNGRVQPFLDREGNAEERGFELVGSQLEHNGNYARFYLLKMVN